MVGEAGVGGVVEADRIGIVGIEGRRCDRLAENSSSRALNFRFRVRLGSFLLFFRTLL